MTLCASSNTMKPPPRRSRLMYCSNATPITTAGNTSGDIIRLVIAPLNGTQR